MIAHEDVGVKLLVALATEHSARIRAEIASLRRLRVLGVTQLLDEGVEAGFVFLVMPLLRGEPFPGRAVPTKWEDMTLSTELLLETLARVHAEGIVHRDLKPANVLVDANGRPTLLDFGLSVVTAFGEVDDSGRLIGTPAYLAPEQVRGERVDNRTDLYAVGVMLYQALSGRFPHEAPSVTTLLAAKSSSPVPLRVVTEAVPAHVASAVDSLLATDPDQRPWSALDALARLRGSKPQPAPVTLWLERARPAGARFTVDDLKELFAGFDRLSWLRGDAARILFELTSGDPGQVRARVAMWLRSGRCRWEAGPESQLLIDRDALDELDDEWGSRPRTQDSAFVENAMVLARALAESGRVGKAIFTIQEGLFALRRGPTPTAESLRRVLSLWVEIALAEGTPQALDRVLYEICRAGTTAMRELEALVRAALAVGAWSHRASDLAESVPPFDSPGLELRRLGVRVLAARRGTVGREESVVLDTVDIASRSPEPRLRSSASGWLGKLRYRQGAYDEAARLHLAAANTARWRTERIAASLHAASATLEAFREEDALAIALTAREEARECRNSYLAGRAEWLVRSALYRLGRCHTVDDELLAAARLPGAPDIFGIICLVESAHAYRACDPRAASLALEAHHWWARAGEPIASLLAGSLAVAAGETVSVTVRERLRVASWTCHVPGIGIQTAALLREGGEHAPPVALVDQLARTVPHERWARRMDILSVDESIAILGR